MSQYTTGHVAATNGSAVITGTSTLWLANVSTGDTFKIEDIDAVYDIGSVDSDTQITLTANWAGATTSGESYQITRDFTSNENLLEIWKGDKDWPYHLTQSLRKIDTALWLQKYTAVVHTDSYELTLSDLGKSHKMNSSADKIFTLPAATSDYDGYRVTFIKMNTGKLTIQVATGDYVHDSSVSGTIYNASGATYATLTLEWNNTNQKWYKISSAETWVTT